MVMLAPLTRRPAAEMINGVEPAEVTVLVVDDLDAFRRVAAGVIAECGGFVLAGEASTGEEAIAFLEARLVGLVLMDVRMPGIGGVAAAREIRRRFPRVAVILLSVDRLELLPPLSGVTYCHKSVFGPDELERLWDVCGRTAS
jgi:CheY-like chemotaxis protein